MCAREILVPWLVTTMALSFGCTADDDSPEFGESMGHGENTDGGDGDGRDTDAFPDDDDPMGEQPEVCAAEVVNVEPKDPRIMFVLDKSESMGSHVWDHDADPNTPDVTRWHSLHGTVESILHRHATETAFGAVLFPSIDPEQSDQCTMLDRVDVPLAKDNEDDIIGHMPTRAARPLGGSPASVAMTLAVDHLMAQGGSDPRSIVLITDGGANCMAGEPDQLGVYDEDLLGVVEDARMIGISTYVVGIDVRDELADRPRINPLDKLNEIAVAGGVAFDGPQKFYNAADDAELAQAVEEVTRRVPCDVELSDPPPKRALFSVTIDGVDIPEADDCQIEDGYAFTRDDRSALQLCGSACERFTYVHALETEAVCIPQG